MAASATQAAKKPQFTSRPTELEQISRPHLEITADSANDSSSVQEKNSFDDFESEIENDFLDTADEQIQIFYTSRLANLPPLRRIMPLSQAEMCFTAGFEEQPCIFASDITSLIDWVKAAANYSQIEIMEASQSIDINRAEHQVFAAEAEQPVQSALEHEFQNGMFEMEHTNQDVFDICLSTGDYIVWQDYEDRRNKLYHSPKVDYYLMQQDYKTRQLPRFRKAADRRKAAVQAEVSPQPQPQHFVYETQAQVEITQPAAVKPEPEELASEAFFEQYAKQIQVGGYALGSKKLKAKKRQAKVKQPCTCSYIPYVAGEQIDGFLNAAQNVILLPFKVLGFVVLAALFFGGLVSYSLLKEIADLFLFVLSFWQSRNFRFPVVTAVFILPLAFSLLTFGIKMLLTCKFSSRGAVSSALDEARVLNYNFFDPLERNYLPPPAVRNSFLSQIAYATQYEKTIRHISNFQQMKFLSTRLNNQYYFEVTECETEFLNITQDDTRLLLDDFRTRSDFSSNIGTIYDCAYIYTSDVYLAVPCSFYGPTAPSSDRIAYHNIRSRLEINGDVVFTFSDYYGNSLRLFAGTTAELYLMRNEDTYALDFSRMFILTSGRQYTVESLYYNRGAEMLGNIFLQETVDSNEQVRLLVPHDDYVEVTLGITVVSLVEDIPKNYVRFDSRNFEVLNTQLRGICKNSVDYAAQLADSASLMYNYWNLKEQIQQDNEALPIDIERHYLQMANWYLHQSQLQDDRGNMLYADGYRYYYLIYNMYMHYFLLLVVSWFLIKSAVRIVWRQKNTIVQGAIFATIVLCFSLGCYFGGRYLLAFYFVSSLPEKLVLCQLIIYIVEKSLFHKINIYHLVLILLIDHVQRVFDSANRFQMQSTFVSVLLFLRAMSTSYSLKCFIKSQFRRNLMDVQAGCKVTLYEAIYLRAIDHPAANQHSFVISMFSAMSKVFARFHLFFTAKKPIRSAKSAKKAVAKAPLMYYQQQTHQKLPFNLAFSSRHFTVALFPESFAPWSAEIIRLNQLNCQTLAGYGALQTNVRVTANESLVQPKEKVVLFHPPAIAIPTLPQLAELAGRLPQHFPRFLTYSVDILTDKTMIPLHSIQQQAINPTPYQAKLKYFILPSQRQQVHCIDINNITTNSEDSTFEEICFFSTSLGLSYQAILGQINAPGKLFNYLVYPYIKLETLRAFSRRYNQAVQAYLGGIRQIAVQDVGYEAAQSEPPVYAIIRDDFIPKLTKAELVFIVAVLFRDSLTAGLLPPEKHTQTYSEFVTCELYTVYAQIADELCGGYVAYAQCCSVDQQYLVFLAENTPLLEPEFFSANAFQLKRLCYILQDGFDGILSYAESVVENPLTDHLPELQTLQVLRPLLMPIGHHYCKLFWLIGMAHYRLVEREILSFLGYCSDVLLCALLRQHGYVLKSDSQALQFVHGEGQHAGALNDECADECAERFLECYKAERPFYLSYLCAGCRGAFFNYIYTVLNKYENFAAHRFSDVQQRYLLHCQCQEDVMAVLVNSGVVGDEFVRQILRRETGFLHEARTGGNYAFGSARSCLIQLNGQRFAFNLRNACEALYSLLVSKARADLARRFGLRSNWLENTRENQRAALLGLARGKRMRVVFEDGRSATLDGVEFDVSNTMGLSTWAYAVIL